ncbi:transporter [Penicillium riverlandense]|uniref:transporter n=1 Tax=Penicillium riverlandense TaxID=1903569 RepID=UPI0025469F64|nr:transporter [Penicillium riverlandense]KAJ5825313.1 transporter [Penicillium riverlandense]
MGRAQSRFVKARRLFSLILHEGATWGILLSSIPSPSFGSGILLTLVPFFGSIVLLTLLDIHKWGIVVSRWLAAQSSSLMVVSLSLMAFNVKGNAKKPTTNAIFFLGYSTGYIIGPQLWQAPDAPRYIKDRISSIFSWVLLVMFFGMYYVLFRWENFKRRTLLLQQTEDETGHEAPPEQLEKGPHVGVDVNSDSADRPDLI